MSTIIVEPGPSGSVVRPTGEIDLANVRALEMVLDLTIAQDDRLVVDLRDVTFMDGRAMRALLTAAGRLHARGGGLQVRAAPPMARRLVGLCGQPCPFSFRPADRSDPLA